MNFVAIDFETANSKRSSICSVGIAVVAEGQIVDQCHLYVRPEPFYFDSFNVAIHGITENDVQNSPRFEEIWPHLSPKFVGPLIAHNAAFDMSVLRCALDQAQIPYPELDYFCTRVISKAAWPGYPTYALDYVAKCLGIEFEHHNAQEDARACADVARTACSALKANSLYAVEDLLKIHRGSLFPGGYRSCGGAGAYSPRPKTGQPLRAHDAVARTSEAHSDHPFSGKHFVFTGAMLSMTRDEAMREVVSRGGACHDTVTSITDFLVLGEKGYAGYRSGRTSGKTNRAEVLIKQGQSLEILPERDFLKLL